MTENDAESSSDYQVASNNGMKRDYVTDTINGGFDFWNSRRAKPSRQLADHASSSSSSRNHNYQRQF